MCDDEVTYIDWMQFCNGVMDCPGNDDEAYCGHEEPSWEEKVSCYDYRHLDLEKTHRGNVECLMDVFRYIPNIRPRYAHDTYLYS